MPDEIFWVKSSVRLPGLGVLLLPAPPAPAWLAGPALHTTLPVRLHQPGQPALSLVATLEEISQVSQLPIRALLLDADPGGEVSADAWLELLPGPVAFG